MKLQKNVSITELLHLCENHGYIETMQGLKELHDKEKTVAAKAVQMEKIKWLEEYISAASFDGSDNSWNDLPF